MGTICCVCQSVSYTTTKPAAREAITVRKSICITAILMVFFDLPVAHTSECRPLSKVLKNNQPIILGVNKSSPPFSFVKNGRPKGYMVELCKKAIQVGFDDQDSRKHRFEFQIVDNIKEQFDALSKGRIDIVCTPTTHTVSRRSEYNVSFSLTVFLTGASFLSRAERSIEEIGDLESGRVTAVKNTTTFQGLEAAIDSRNFGEKIYIDYVKDHDEGAVEVVRGNAIAHVGDQALLLPYLEKYPRLRLGNKLNSFEPYAIAIRRCDHGGLDRIDKGISKIFRSGEIWEIYRANFNHEPGRLLISTYIINGLPN